MTPAEFVASVQAWTSAINQSIPFLVITATLITAAWARIFKHEKALNGELDARIDQRAKAVIHEVVNNHPAVTGSSSNSADNTKGNVPTTVA